MSKDKISKHIFTLNGGYRVIFPSFQNCVCCQIDLKDNEHDTLHLAFVCLFGWLVGFSVFFFGCLFSIFGLVCVSINFFFLF